MLKVFVIQVVVFLIIAIGWIMNVVKLVKCDFEAPYKAEVIRGIGLIPPIGMIVGWMNISDGVEVPEVIAE